MMPESLDRAGRQRLLENWLALAVPEVQLPFMQQLLTPATISSFRGALVDDLNMQIRHGYMPAGIPYELSVKPSGIGSIHVAVTALETGQEAKERVAAEAHVAKLAAIAKVENDKARAAAHPHRARAFLDVGGDPAIDIAGMIEDLQHWRPPPDALGGEEALGFEIAIADVINYLRTRARRAK